MDLVKILESYRGKDRVIRLATYVLMLLGGRGNTPLQAKFRKISVELGGCRIMLRLFDDLSMLMLNLSKGFGFRVCGQAECELLKNAQPEEAETPGENRGHELNSQQAEQIADNLKKLAADRRDLILAIIQSAADLTNAVSWLPKGFLWSQKLSPSANGLCGILATLIMLYRNWPSK